MSYQLGPIDPHDRVETIPEYGAPEPQAAYPAGGVRWLRLGAIATGLAVLFSGGLYVAYSQGKRSGQVVAVDTGSGPSPSGADAPLIRADDKATRVKPDQPGGMKVPDQDKLIYTQGGTPPGIERLLPPAEKPMSRPTPSPAAPPQAATPAPPPAAAVTPEPTPPATVQPKPPAAGLKPAPAKPGQQQAPAPKPEAAKPDPAKPVPAAGGLRLQVGSVKTAEAAKQEWDRIKRKNGDLLANVSAVATKADLGDRGVWYRIQAGPVADSATAERLCAELKRREVGCSIVR